MKYNEIAEAAEQFMKLAAKKDEKLDPKAKVRNRGAVVFPADSPKVLDDKDHFPLNTENQARNALRRVNQYKKVPSWYKGTLQSLVSAVAKKVHSKYPEIEISEKSTKPGKG